MANPDKNQSAATEAGTLDNSGSAATDNATASGDAGTQRQDGEPGTGGTGGQTSPSPDAAADDVPSTATVAGDPQLPIDPASRPAVFAANFLPPDPAQANDEFSERSSGDSTVEPSGYAAGSSAWLPAGQPQGYAQQSPYAPYDEYEPAQGHEGYGPPGGYGSEEYGQQAGYGQGPGYAPVEGYGYAAAPEYGEHYAAPQGYGGEQRYTDEGQYGQPFGYGEGYAPGQAVGDGPAQAYGAEGYQPGQPYGDAQGHQPGQPYDDAQGHQPGQASGYAPVQGYGAGQGYSPGQGYGGAPGYAPQAEPDAAADSDREPAADQSAGRDNEAAEDSGDQEPGQYQGSAPDRVNDRDESQAAPGPYSRPAPYPSLSPYPRSAPSAQAGPDHRSAQPYGQQAPARGHAESAPQPYGSYPQPGPAWGSGPPAGSPGGGYQVPPGAVQGSGPQPGGRPPGSPQPGPLRSGAPQPGSPGAPQQGAPRPGGETLAPLPAHAQEQQLAAETADDLTLEALLPGKGTVPGAGWRRLIYKTSGGLIRPRESAEAVRRRDLINRVRTPVAGGHHRVAVMSLKGGVGKTTTTVSLGSMLASLRGDRIIALDANPDRGTLSDKVRLETAATVRDLLNERDQIRRYADVRAFTSQAPSRLEVLASDRDPAVSVAFCEEDYYDAAQVLEHYYSISLTDCGTGLLHSAMAGVLQMADQIVLVSSPSVDGARSASATLDWLDAHEYGDLVRNAVVVLSMIRPRSKSSVDLDRLEHHFASRCRAVARIPYDAHLEEGAEVDLELMSPATVNGYLVLAATVGDGFAWPRRGARRTALGYPADRGGRSSYRRYVR